MNLQRISIVLVTCILFFASAGYCHGDSSKVFTQLGVNLAGAEFGTSSHGFSNHNPGQYNKDYVYPCLKTMKYFSSNGLGLFRIPFRWERIQPQLEKPLDPNELAKLHEVVQNAAALQSHVILDLHNYVRYQMENQGKIVKAVVGDANQTAQTKVTVENLCDLWRRLAKEFKGNPAVVAYGIMNEPHDIPENGPSWHEISRAVVRAIRDIDPDTTILVPGDRWSSARFFPQANGPTPWIDEKVTNIVYEAHLYFDHDGSGRYQRDYRQALQQNTKLPRSGSDYVQPFVNWCNRNQVQGFIGEFGVPSDPGWTEIMEDFLQTIRRNKIGGCYWAAGPWWGNYPLSIQPQQKQTEHKPQLKILKRYATDESP